MLTLRARIRVLLTAATLAFLLATVAAPAAANRLCVTNTDPDNSHRFLWMHAKFDYAIHEKAIPAASAACFDSEFLLGTGWYVKGIVQLYDDRYQTAGDEVPSEPVDMGADHPGRRVDLCFEFNRVKVSYAFRSGDCP